MRPNPYADPARDYGVIPLPRGRFFEYHTTGETEYVGPPKRNPIIGKKFGRPTHARFSVGFRTSRKTERMTGLPVDAPVSIEDLNEVLDAANRLKDGSPAGYTVTPQTGRYVKGKKVVDEPGVRVELFPEENMTTVRGQDEFFRRINQVGFLLTKLLDQREVYYELVINGIFVSTGSWEYVLTGTELPYIDFRAEAEELGAL